MTLAQITSTQAQASVSLAGDGVVTLREYQQRLVDGIRASLQSGHRRIMAYLPTGGGKTRVATAITHNDALSKSPAASSFWRTESSLCISSPPRCASAGLDVGIAQGENTDRTASSRDRVPASTPFMPGSYHVR
jgi:hypothetical protein